MIENLSYNRKSSDNLVLLLSISVVLITVFSMIRLESMVSLVFNVSLLLLFISFIKDRLRTKCTASVTMCIILSIVPVFFNLIFADGDIKGVQYFNKVLLFLSTVIFFYYCYTVEVSSIKIRRVKICMLLTALLLPVSYFVLGNTEMIAGYILLHYNNTNFAGMWLSTSIVAASYLFVSYENKILKLFVLCVLLIDIWLLYINFTRSCWLAVAFFVIMLSLGRLFNRQSLSPIFLKVIIVSPIVFSIIYMLMLDYLESPTFDIIVSEGKTITSRSSIWKHAFNVISNNILIGDYYGISKGTGMSQLHNIGVDIVVSYGIFALVAFSFAMYTCTRFITNNWSWKSYVAMCGFLAALISGWFEAALVAGSMGLNYYIGMLLLFSKYEYNIDNYGKV